MKEEGCSQPWGGEGSGRDVGNRVGVGGGGGHVDEVETVLADMEVDAVLEDKEVDAAEEEEQEIEETEGEMEGVEADEMNI